LQTAAYLHEPLGFQIPGATPAYAADPTTGNDWRADGVRPVMWWRLTSEVLRVRNRHLQR